MLFETTTQFAVLGLIFVAGLLFGLAMHPGGKKWRTRYERERDAHNTYRTGADKRVAETEARVRAAEARADDAERRLARPVAADAPVAAVPRAHQPYVADPAVANPSEKPVFISNPVSQASAHPARTDPPRGWFDFR